MRELFLTILNMSIASSVVIAVILLGRLLLKNAPKKWSYLLWIAAAFRLCCPVSIRSAFSLFRVLPQPEAAKTAASTAGETVGRLNYIPAAVNAPAPTSIPAAPSALPIKPLPLTQATSIPSVATVNPVITSAPVTLNPVAGAVTNEVTNTAAPANPLQVAMTVLTVLWLAGIAALIIYAIVDYIRLRKNVSTATILAGENKVFESENIRSPFILGFIRPRIYIPYGLSERERQYVLAHERTHLRRGDHIIKAFSFVLLALHWFNPLCWLAFFLMSRDMEMSCDETVLAKNNIRKEYSTTLLSFAAGKRFSLPAPGPITFGETAVKERIKNAMKYKKPKLIVTIIAVMLCVVIVAACATNPLGEKQDAEKDANSETTQEQTETTPEPTPAITPKPTETPAKPRGALTFINSIGENIDNLHVDSAGWGLERVQDPTRYEGTIGYTPGAGPIASGESAVINLNRDMYSSGRLASDVCVQTADKLYVLHDFSLGNGDTVELRRNGDSAEFLVTYFEGDEETVPAEIYDGDPLAVAARDENILQLEPVKYYCTVMQDSSRTEGYRVEWTDYPVQCDFNNKAMIATVSFEFVKLSEEDAARFPALATALEANNDSLRSSIADSLGELDRVVDREGPAEYNLASYIRRADTRILSVLYQIWCGDPEYRHPEPAEMSARRYESATFDTQTGRLLEPNDVAVGIDGNIKYEPHENFAWTYDNNGVSFFLNDVKDVPTPCLAEFHPVDSGIFAAEYLPFTENYVTAFSVLPDGESLTVVQTADGEMTLNFTVERRNGYTSDGGAWFESTFSIRACVNREYIDYSIETGWDNPHIDRILFVHVNGRDYLYVLKDEPNNYSILIFGIHNGRIFRVARSGGALQKLPVDFTDPLYYKGDAWPFVLGTHLATCHFGVSSCGLPVRLDWYSLYEEHTVLKELELKIVTEDGRETGETVVLQPGWKVIFFRTDGETLADILLPDGRIARVELDGPASMTIGGDGVSSIFDNITVWD